MLFKIGVLKTFAKSAGKHPCWSPLFNKVASVKTCNIIKKKLQHKCFPVNSAKFLRMFLEHIRWPLLMFSEGIERGYWPEIGSNHCVKYRNFTNFLVWKFCGKTQFPHSFGQFARNYAEIPPNFHTRKLGKITVFFAVNVSFLVFS